MADCHTRGQTRTEWRRRADGLEESVQFTPGYNCSDFTMKGHGVHGMEIWWWLRGPAGAATFFMSTSWIPGKTWAGHGQPPVGAPREHWLTTHGPHSGWVGYHARRPQYEGQELDHASCQVIGGPCYAGGSYTQAQQVMDRFIVDGEHVIWAELEQLYKRLVDEENNAAAAARQS